MLDSDYGISDEAWEEAKQLMSVAGLEELVPLVDTRCADRVFLPVLQPSEVIHGRTSQQTVQTMLSKNESTRRKKPVQTMPLHTTTPTVVSTNTPTQAD